MQTRLFHFRRQPTAAVKPTWQGESTAQWVMAGGGRGQGQGGATGRDGRCGRGSAAIRIDEERDDAVASRNLRKNGVPYSANTILTEHWDVHKRDNGDEWMVATIVVDDSANLRCRDNFYALSKRTRRRQGGIPSPARRNGSCGEEPPRARSRSADRPSIGAGGSSTPLQRLQVRWCS